MAERDLVVKFVGDDRDLDRALKKQTKQVDLFGSRFTKLNQSLRGGIAGSGVGARGSLLFGSGAFIGAASITAAISATTSAASDLNESVSKSRQVFGEASKSVEQFGDTSARSFGISKQQAVEAAATFGNLFRTVGLAGQQNAEFSSSLVKLSADLASFNNADPSETLLALRSGLIGEAEPLRRFGVLLSEARVQQQAMAETGKTSAKALTNQEKVLARYHIILKDTVPAQGDFARTSEGLANQQRILRAQTQDLSAALGRVLLPAMIGIVSALNDAITAGKDLAGVLQQLANLPGIEIPVKLVSNVTSGRGGDILRHIVLGQISPLALGITIGKEIVDGIRQGSESASLSPPPHSFPGAGRATTPQATAAAGQAAIDRATRAAAERSLQRQLTDSLTRAAHIRDLILRDPSNAKLQQRLTAELKKQQQLREQIAAAAKTAAAADREAARSARDAARAAREAAAAAAEEARQRARDRAEAAAALRKSSQFRALGLTATGDQPVAGIGTLRRRGHDLIDQLKHSGLDPKRIRQAVKRISAIFTKQFDNAGRDVRQAILEMFATIAGALNQGSKSVSGPLTKTHGLNTHQILQGLGLSESESRALRARLSHFTSAGQELSRGGGGKTRTTGGDGGTGVPNFEFTFVIDGQKFTNVITRQQQKTKRRNPQQKRGPHRKN